MGRLSYAILFEEGPGYLLVDRLGRGASGVVSKVFNAENQIYARKIDLAPVRKTSHLVPDVDFARIHTNIPRLITLREYTSTAHPDFCFTATVWEFCNGGTLFGLADRLFSVAQTHEAHKTLPEVLIWKFSYEALNVLIDTTTHEEPLVHNDAHTGNIFLHWNPEDQFPTLLLGDWGGAALLTDSSIYESVRNSGLKPRLQRPLQPGEALYLTQFLTSAAYTARKVRDGLADLTTALEGVQDSWMRPTTSVTMMASGYSPTLAHFFDKWKQDMTALLTLLRNHEDNHSECITHYIVSLESLRNIAKDNYDLALAQPVQPSATSNVFDISVLRPDPPPAASLPLLYNSLNEIASNLTYTYNGEHVLQLPHTWRDIDENDGFVERMQLDLSHCKVMEIQIHADGSDYTRGPIVPWDQIN